MSASHSKVTPFLWFDHDQALLAAQFYISVFSTSPSGAQDSRILSTTPLVTTFTLGGSRFSALNGGPTFKFSPAISLYITCEDQAEVDHFWTAFAADGGTPSRCGWIADKYGVSWQVVPKALSELLGSEDKEGAARAMKAMLAMGRLDVEGLRSAFKGGVGS